MPPLQVLHEDGFELQSITCSVNKNPTHDPTWQIWIMLYRIIDLLFFSQQLLEVCLTECASGIPVLTKGW